MPRAAPTDSTAIIEAALRRLQRAHGIEPLPRVPRSKLGAPAPVPAKAAPGPRKPVVTLEAPGRRGDPRALAALLADDVAAKLDQLCYVWNVISELEPFVQAGEPSLRRRAAELLLVAAGGSADLPIEGPLRAVRSFLAAHGMSEEYIDHLADWYLAS
jgi:hypothetical protein